MELREKISGDICIISISGHMDNINAKDIEDKINEVIERDRPKIIINMAEVEYISSAGLRVLLAANKKQKLRNGVMEIVSTQPFIEKVFNVTGLDRVFALRPTEEEAIKCLTAV